MKQVEMARRLRELHQGPTFLLGNAWSVGSAKRLVAAGFQAIGTTSGGLALDRGVKDGEVGREETLKVAGAIAQAIDVPVSADLENGFGDRPEDCVATVLEAIRLGVAGGSIEDATGRPDEPIYPFDLAVERVRAVVQTVRQSGSEFVLTARAENFCNGRLDLADTIARLKAFEAVGADVLFAPALPDLSAIRTVRAAVSKPINVMISHDKPGLGPRDLMAAQVNRISFGSGFTRAAFQGLEGSAHLWISG